MKILVLADVPRDPNSGAPGSILEILRELSARPEVECEAVLGDGLPHRIRHPKLHNLLEQPLGYLKAAMKRNSNGRFHIIGAYQPASWLLARFLRWNSSGTLLVNLSQGFEAHVDWVLRRWRGLEAPDSRPFWRRVSTVVLDFGVRASCRAVARYAYGFVMTNSSCKQFLIERYGVSPERIWVMPLGVSEEYLEAPLPERRWKPARILLVGQAETFKAPRVSLAILDTLFDREPSLQATWVGPPSAQRLISTELAARHRDRLHWINWMPRRELLRVFDGHDLLLFPSYLEGFGKIMVEAMARGLVVVATDQGGPRDVIRPGLDGWLFPVGDVSAGVAACWRVLQDPELRATMSEAARRRAFEYRWGSIVDELLEFYRELLSRDSPGVKHP